MGLSLRIASRLFKLCAERERRNQNFCPLSSSLILQNNNFTACHKTRSPNYSFFIGASLLIHFLALLKHIRYQTTLEWSYLLPLPLLVTSLLASVWLFLYLPTRMEMTCIHAAPFSGYKPIVSKIIDGSKRNFLRMEEVYLQMKNFSLLINQLVFFCLCERVLLGKQPVASFYTLMFFNVIAYCVAYIKELIEREDWSMYVNIARGSSVRHLAMSTTKIVLEWTKAVTFIITVVFILLVFGLEKGLKNYSPSLIYLLITGIYFLISEKVFVQLIQKGLDFVKFECFENMENLYSPVILKGSQILLSMIFTVICGLLGHFRITLLSVFTNIRMKYKELENNHWRPLKWELIRLTEYRSANKEEILRHDDVCAICLQPMKTARVTPCRHFFHADCLIKCLAASSQSCPICKQELPALVLRRYSRM